MTWFLHLNCRRRTLSVDFPIPKQRNGLLTIGVQRPELGINIQAQGHAKRRHGLICFSPFDYRDRVLWYAFCACGTPFALHALLNSEAHESLMELGCFHST